MPGVRVGLGSGSGGRRVAVAHVEQHTVDQPERGCPLLLFALHPMAFLTNADLHASIGDVVDRDLRISGAFLGILPELLLGAGQAAV